MSGQSGSSVVNALLKLIMRLIIYIYYYYIIYYIYIDLFLLITELLEHTGNSSLLLLSTMPLQECSIRSSERLAILNQ